MEQGPRVIGEWQALLRLAAPVILGELAWIAMPVVDTWMLGRVGPEAMGALSIGRAFYMAVGIFGLGTLLSLDTFVSQAYGAGRRDECSRWLAHGLALAAGASLPLAGLYALGVWAIRYVGIEPGVLEQTLGYMKVLGLSLPVLLLYATLRRFLQAIHCVRPVMWALVTANLVNAGGNWVLIFGKLGFPALGAPGAAWATCLALSYMAGFLGLSVFLLYRSGWDRSGAWRERLEVWRLVQLCRVGFPAALQVLLELGVFSSVTALAGRFDATAIASHQIALTAASVTYMVPLGLSSAAAVRVGHGLGRGDPRGAAAAGWSAVATAAAFMSGAGVLFWLAPDVLAGIFSTDPRVIASGAWLLRIAALFQLFDGISAVAVGALRGLGETRAPALATFAAYWIFGLPLGAWLAFARDWQVAGLWVGLTAGLVILALAALGLWIRALGRTRPGRANA